MDLRNRLKHAPLLFRVTCKFEHIIICYLASWFPSRTYLQDTRITPRTKGYAFGAFSRAPTRLKSDRPPTGSKFIGLATSACHVDYSSLLPGWQVAQASILLASIVSQDRKLCPIHRGPIAMSGPRRLAVHSDSISTAPRMPVA